MAFILLPGITNIPLWVKAATTIGDLLARAAQLQDLTPSWPSLSHILDDPDYQSLLNQEVFQSGLLEGNLLNIFNPARQLLIIISFAGQVYRFRLPAGATVRDAKQRMKKELNPDLRKLWTFELCINGSQLRPDGKTRLITLTRLPYQNVCFDLVREHQPSRVPELVSVNERVFRKHLQQSRFHAGVDRGLWRLVSINWPTVVMALGTSKNNSTEHFVLFALDSYPAKPPGIELWNPQHEATVPHDCWPVWFKHFVAEAYPHLITINPRSYSADLLQLSVSIAAREAQACLAAWDVGGDLTQCLAPLIGHLWSQSSRRRGAHVQERRRFRNLVPKQQSASSGKQTHSSPRSRPARPSSSGKIA